MRKYIVLLTLTLAGMIIAQWPGPSNLNAYSFYEDRVILEWTPSTPIVLADTLQNDDGIGDNVANLDTGRCAVRFEPAERCSILSVQIEVLTVLGIRGINIDMFGVNTYGLPNLSDPVMFMHYYFVDIGWNDIDIGSEGIVVDDTFSVRISKGDTLPEMYLYTDCAASSPERSHQYHYMYGWRPLSGDLMVRLVVLYLDSREIVTLTGSSGKAIHSVEPDDFSSHSEIPYWPTPAPRFRPMSPAELIPPDSYTIYRTGTFGTVFNPIASVPGSLATFTDSTVTPCHTYYYTVRAEFDSGAHHSAFSDTAAGTAYAGSGTTIYDTLGYNIGISPTAGVSFPDGIIANDFHVDTRCRLLAVDYHVSTVGQGYPKLYWDNSGEPGVEEYGDVNYIFGTLGWSRVNMATRNVILHDDFYIGIQLNSSLGISLREIPSAGHAWDLPPCGVWSEIPDTNYYIRALVQYANDSAYYHLYPGWNAVSLPVVPEAGLAPHVAFPAADFIYEWDADSVNYVVPENLRPGKGYFVYVPTEQRYTVPGVPIHMYTLYEAGPGWEFIGSLSDFEGADTNCISEIPSTLINQRIFYYFDRSTGWGSYGYKTKFIPTEAYWMLFEGEGLFELDE